MSDLKPISIRVLPHPYLGAAFLLLFVTAFLLYLDLNIYAAVVGSFAVFAVPLLAVTDRIRFDGRRLTRTGLIPRLLRRFAGVRNSIRLDQIEHVDTQATRAFKRNGRVIYAYKTSIHGRSVTLKFATGSSRYISMISAVFPNVPEDVLDNRSIELRDFYINYREALRRAKLSNIPSPDVLSEMMQKGREVRANIESPFPVDSPEHKGKLADLRRLANQLRVNGALLQASEAFRRAVRLRSTDPWLLFEFAKCLYSFGVSERDHRIERRAVAMLRLAERRAGNDAELLSRIGESYFQIGDWRRSGAVFHRVKDELGETFRSLRGLAELALREGKIAHVILNFSAAREKTQSTALKRWTDREVAYFSRLNSDDEYMELEISRVNLVERLMRARSSSLYVTALGFPVIVAGLLLSWNSIANIGWAVSAAGVAVWFVSNLLVLMLSSRIPVELVENED